MFCNDRQTDRFFQLRPEPPTTTIKAGPTGGVTSGAAPKCGQATRAILKMSCPVLGFSRRDRIGGGGISAILRTLMLSSTSVVGRGAEASWRERPERARRERASWSERHKARGFIHSRRASTRTKRSSDPLAESRKLTHATRETDDNTPPNLSGQILAAD